MTSEMSSAEAGATVSDLELKIAGHRKVLAGLGKRRAKFAFAASQGDKEAAASLAEIEVDEANSTTALRNLELALAEAREYRTVAWRRERQEDDQAAVDAVREMAPQLIEIDRTLLEALASVQELVSDRQRMIGAICDQRVLTPIQASRLSNPAVAGQLLVDAFHRHLEQVGRFNRPDGTLAHLVANDAGLFGIDAERPPLSAVQAALQGMLRPAPWTG